MRKFLHTLVIVLTFAFHFSAQGSEPFFEPVTSLDIAELDLSVRTVDVMIRIAEESSLDHTPLSNTRHWEERMKTYVHLLLTEELQGTDVSAEKALQGISWKKMVSRVSEMRHGIRSVARMSGLGLATAYVVGTVCKVIVPATLSMLGLSQLVPVAVMFPFTVPAITSQHWLESFIEKRKMIKHLGTSSLYKRWKIEQNKLKLKMGIRSQFDFLIPFERADSEYQAVVVKKSTLTQTALNKMGWNTDQLTFENLKRFVKNENVALDTLNLLNHEQRQLPNHVKTMILIYDLQERNLSLEFWEKLESQFSKSFVKVSGQLARPEILEWVKSMSQAQTITELLQRVDTIPEGFLAKEVFGVLERVILPRLAEEGKDIGFRDIRRLIRSTSKIQAEAVLADESMWSLKWNERFKNLLYQTLKLSDCNPLLR